MVEISGELQITLPLWISRPVTRVAFVVERLRTIEPMNGRNAQLLQLVRTSIKIRVILL